MKTNTPGSGREGPDLEGCTKNHCHRARRDGSGKACHQAAGWKTDHAGFGSCKLHGGSTPSHRTAAKVEQAEHAVATYGLAVNVSPAQALLEEVHRTAGHVAWLGSLIAEMERKDLVWGIAEQIDHPPGPESFGGTETKYRAVPNVWLDLYQKERAHLARVCRDALGADAAGRVASVLEQIGGSYLAMFVRVLDRSALPADQRQVVQGFLVEELQALVEGGEPGA